MASEIEDVLDDFNPKVKHRSGVFNVKHRSVGMGGIGNITHAQNAVHLVTQRKLIYWKLAWDYNLLAIAAIAYNGFIATALKHWLELYIEERIEGVKGEIFYHYLDPLSTVCISWSCVVVPFPGYTLLGKVSRLLELSREDVLTGLMYVFVEPVEM